MKALLKFILKILIILCGAFSFYMFFKNALYDNADTYYTAKDLAFGKIVSESTVLGQTTTLKLNQSYMIMAAYCLPLVGAILAFLMIFFKGRIVGFLFSLITFASFVVAFVLLLNIGQLASVELSLSGIINTSTISNLQNYSFTNEAMTTLIALLFGSCFSCSYFCLSITL